MKYAALISGGKDSIYAIHCLEREGHELVCLLYMKGSGEYQDSYMYQTVGSEIAQLFGECLDVPMFTHETECKSLNKDLIYREEAGDEVEDLYSAISMAREKIHFEGVSSGAILSEYQKSRVENICFRLSLKSLAPLWQRSQKELIKEMIQENISARLIKVASSFMGKECINMDLREVIEYLEMNTEFEMNFCGEGGEYESIVLDCPMFRKRIIIDEYEISGHPEETGMMGIVFYMKIMKYSIKAKT